MNKHAEIFFSLPEFLFIGVMQSLEFGLNYHSSEIIFLAMESIASLANHSLSEPSYKQSGVALDPSAKFHSIPSTLDHFCSVIWNIFINQAFDSRLLDPTGCSTLYNLIRARPGTTAHIFHNILRTSRVESHQHLNELFTSFHLVIQSVESVVGNEVNRVRERHQMTVFRQECLVFLSKARALIGVF